MSKAKCEAFARKHNLTFRIDPDHWGYEYEISVPDGMIMDDGTTGRCESEIDEPKWKVWQLLLSDMKDCLEQEWVTIDEFIAAGGVA